MRKRALIIIALLFAGLIAYFLASDAQTQEDLGKLDLYTYDVSQLYCVYKIINADSTDINSYQNGDKICVVCRDGWPNVSAGGSQQCYSRVKFKSASGYYEYEAELFDGLRKECHECTDGKGYYNKP